MKKTILISLVAVFLFSSCSSKIVKWSGHENEFKKWKKFALIELMICPPKITRMPLIFSNIYYASFENIIEEIIYLHTQKALDVHNHLGEIISKYSKNDVLFGSKLFTNPNYLKFKKNISIYDPTLSNADFIKFTIPDSSLNIFDLSEQKTPENYFVNKTLDLYQATFKLICEMLDVDGLVFGTLSVNTTDIENFGITGEREMNLKLYFIDRNGKMLLFGKARSEGTEELPDDLVDYKDNFDQYYKLSEELFRKLYNLPIEE